MKKVAALVYIPELHTKELENNPFCSDGKVHIKLKSKFKSVIGFEGKLTYLVSVTLFNFLLGTNYYNEIEQAPEDLKRTIIKEYIKKYEKSSDFFNLGCTIEYITGVATNKTIKLLMPICRNKDSFLFNKNAKDIQACSLNDFTYTYCEPTLFLKDDGYSLNLQYPSYAKSSDASNKFIKRQTRKTINKLKKSYYDVNSLF